MKKRLMALLLTTVLCLSIIPGAFAAKEKEKGEELTEFSYAEARKVIAYHEWEGVTSRVKEANRKFWLPSGLARMELTEKLKEAGVLAVYMASDMKVVVAYSDYDGISMEEYVDSVTERGCKNILHQEINGIDTLVYDEKQSDGTIARIAASQELDGRYLEFVFYIGKKLSDMSNVSIATIRPIK